MIMDAKKLLYELKFEMDRIYINGLRSAKNNSRIIRALPVLEKRIGEDVAYKTLHSALKKLISPGLGSSVDTLSEIYTSLSYLLRFYGEVIAPDEERMEQEPIFNLDDIAVKQHTFLELKSLMNALTGIGKDRVEVIRKAREEKLFDDIRTYSYLDKALSDKQSDVTDLVEDIIKNDIGDKILPFLLSRFEANDKEENLKRLNLLYELKYDGLDELQEEILESDAVNLQAKVIEYISNNVAYEDLLIELSESPQKLLREKALFGLSNLKTEKAEKKLYDLYAKAVKKKGKGDLELFVRALSQTELRYTFDDVLSQAREVLNSIIVANKKAEADLFSYLRMAISVLKQKKTPEVYDFMLEILFNEDYNAVVDKKKHALAKPAKMVSYAIIDTARELDTEQLIAFYEKVIHEMKESEWKLPFYKMYLKASIHKGDSKEHIYDVFAPYYRNKSIVAEDIAEICGIVDGSSEGSSNVIDSRWLDELYTTLEHVDEEESIEVLLQVLDALEPDSSERYNQELVKAGEKTKKHLLEITAMVMKRNLPDKFETVYSLIKHCHDQGASGSNALRQLPKATYWDEFPKEFAAKFRELKNAPRAISAKILEN